MKIAIITNGAFPVPATKGGAMETLVEEIIEKNQNDKENQLEIISIYDAMAKEEAKNYPYTKFLFIKPNSFWFILDRMIHFFAFNLLKKKNHLAYKTIFQRLIYIYDVAKTLDKNSYDKLVFENQLTLLWALKYKKNCLKYKGKYYFHLHNHPAKYLNTEDLARNCKKIIGVSEFISKAFSRKINYEYNEENFSILRNCVDEKMFSLDKVTEQDLINIKKKHDINNEKIVLFTGRLMKGKGVKEVIEAFKQIRTEDTILMIVGSFNFKTDAMSEYEVELKKLLDDKLMQRIIFTGYVEYSNIPKYYALADVVVLPSICEDAAPLTVIENITMNRPLITTTMGGIPEYADESCAILLENGNQLVSNITLSIDKLLNDKKLCQQMAQKSKIKSKDWILENYYKNFIDILSK